MSESSHVAGEEQENQWRVANDTNSGERSDQMQLQEPSRDYETADAAGRNFLASPNLMASQNFPHTNTMRKRSRFSAFDEADNWKHENWKEAASGYSNENLGHIFQAYRPPNSAVETGKQERGKQSSIASLQPTPCSDFYSTRKPAPPAARNALALVEEDASRVLVEINSTREPYAVTQQDPRLLYHYYAGDTQNFARQTSIPDHTLAETESNAIGALIGLNSDTSGLTNGQVLPHSSFFPEEHDIDGQSDDSSSETTPVEPPVLGDDFPEAQLDVTIQPVTIGNSDRYSYTHNSITVNPQVCKPSMEHNAAKKGKRILETIKSEDLIPSAAFSKLSSQSSLVSRSLASRYIGINGSPANLSANQNSAVDISVVDGNKALSKSNAEIINPTFARRDIRARRLSKQMKRMDSYMEKRRLKIYRALRLELERKLQGLLEYECIVKGLKQEKPTSGRISTRRTSAVDISDVWEYVEKVTDLEELRDFEMYSTILQRNYSIRRNYKLLKDENDLLTFKQKCLLLIILTNMQNFLNYQISTLKEVGVLKRKYFRRKLQAKRKATNIPEVQTEENIPNPASLPSVTVSSLIAMDSVEPEDSTNGVEGEEDDDEEEEEELENSQSQSGQHTQGDELNGDSEMVDYQEFLKQFKPNDLHSISSSKSYNLSSGFGLSAQSLFDQSVEETSNDEKAAASGNAMSKEDLKDLETKRNRLLKALGGSNLARYSVTSSNGTSTSSASQAIDRRIRTRVRNHKGLQLNKENNFGFTGDGDSDRGSDSNTNGLHHHSSHNGGPSTGNTQRTSFRRTGASENSFRSDGEESGFNNESSSHETLDESAVSANQTTTTTARRRVGRPKSSKNKTGPSTVTKLKSAMLPGSLFVAEPEENMVFNNFDFYGAENDLGMIYKLRKCENFNFFFADANNNLDYNYIFDTDSNTFLAQELENEQNHPADAILSTGEDDQSDLVNKFTFTRVMRGESQGRANDLTNDITMDISSSTTGGDSGLRQSGSSSSDVGWRHEYGSGSESSNENSNKLIVIPPNYLLSQDFSNPELNNFPMIPCRKNNGHNLSGLTKYKYTNNKNYNYGTYSNSFGFKEKDYSATFMKRLRVAGLLKSLTKEEVDHDLHVMTNNSSTSNNNEQP